MPVPVNKKQLKKAIEDNYSKLKEELLSIPVSLTGVPELEGHSKNTVMSIHNLVAYLIGWGELVLTWSDKRSKGQEVDFPETGYKWNELGKLAQKFYKDYQQEDYEKLLKKLERTTEKIISLVSSKTNKELYGAGWYGKHTLGKMIQLNTASPFKNAKDRLRRLKKKLT